MRELEDANDFSNVEIDKIFDQLANELKLKSSSNETEDSNIKNIRGVWCQMWMKKNKLHITQ